MDEKEREIFINIQKEYLRILQYLRSLKSGNKSKKTKVNKKRNCTRITEGTPEYDRSIKRCKYCNKITRSDTLFEILENESLRRKESFRNFSEVLRYDKRRRPSSRSIFDETD